VSLIDKIKAIIFPTLIYENPPKPSIVPNETQEKPLIQAQTQAQPTPKVAFEPIIDETQLKLHRTLTGEK
jgi:hypothetical protein